MYVTHNDQEYSQHSISFAQVVTPGITAVYHHVMQVVTILFVSLLSLCFA
jgi:hypothetical protein